MSLGLWKYDRVTGYWQRERSVTPETAAHWLEVFRHDEPREFFKVSKVRPSKSPPGHEPIHRQRNPGPARHSAAWDRCVRDVKRKGSAVSPYAVCTASLQELSFRGKNPVRDPAHRKLVSQLKKHFEMDERALRKKNPSRRRGSWPKGKMLPHLKRFVFK